MRAFLASRERIVLPQTASPQISILLVLFNQAAFTLRCLRAIAANARLAVEVVIVDNGSTDQTHDLLDRLDGARITRNADNRHYVRSVNQAAQLAHGQALLLLNNDAFIRSGALEAAWSTLLSAPDVGAVGGPLVLPDGTLQEAGSIVWSDGSCTGYGRGCNPSAPEFQFTREVDFCSGAFLLIRRSLFELLGGLDEAFAPAYYEEADLCMRLRKAGWRVLFEPAAIADHVEFASSPSTQLALSLQAQHRSLFVQRHGATLAMGHLSPDQSELRARMRSVFRGRLLMIEDRVPFPSLGSGYPRSARMVHELIGAGWVVTLYPLLFPYDEWADIRANFPNNLEVMLGRGRAGLRRFLHGRRGLYDAVLVTRPHNMRAFLRSSDNNAEGTRLIYDAEAIFADRQLASLEIAGVRISEARRRRLLESEIRLARAADLVIAVTERDAAAFRAGGCDDVHVLGHALQVAPTEAAFSARGDLLFVGALDGDPSPNTDALVWFTSEIMPRLDALIGRDYRLIVAGRCSPERLAQLSAPRVRLLGLVDDLTPLYAGARVFIAPTRFAAGIPLKIQEAAARGLPVVATQLLASQLGWDHEKELLVADTADRFAAACARLYRDPTLWQQLRDAALARISADCDEKLFAERLRGIVQSDRPRFRDGGLPGQARSARHSFGALRRPAVVPSAWRRLPLSGWARSAKSGFVELWSSFRRRDYATWIQLYDTIHAADLSAIRAHIAALTAHPIFALIIVADSSAKPGAVRASLDSVCEQIYPHWELWVTERVSAQPVREALDEYTDRDPRIRALRCELAVSDAAAANAAVAHAGGQFVAIIAPGDRLRPQTLYMLAAAHNADPDLEAMYTDEDTDTGAGGGRCTPVFKPDWSPESFLFPEAIGRLLAMRRGALIAAGGYRDSLGNLMESDLLLRIVGASGTARIKHLPVVLYHRGGSAVPAAREALRHIVREHLQRMQERADVDIDGGVLRVSYRLADPPPVSIIVPTRDQAALLCRCVTGLLQGTGYPRIEVIIVDNGSTDPEACRLLRELSEDRRVRVIPFPQQFNYAAMNNRAVADAAGDVVALLNDDVDVRHDGWLWEMVSHAVRPGVGAVGAKLHYPDGTIQHAGVVTGMLGIAGHRFRHANGAEAGPGGVLKRTQTVSCVTGACMVLRRALYEEVGGMDEINLPVSYNDVDLCLRLRARGYRIVWTPWAELDHCESATRGADSERRNADRALAEAEYMRGRWGTTLSNDPFFSPNLTLSAEDGGLAFPPRVILPWADFSRQNQRAAMR